MAYSHPDQDLYIESNGVSIEEVLKLIAEKFIESSVVDPSVVSKNQKAITAGLIKVGRSNSKKLLIFESDKKANIEDTKTTDTINEEPNVSLESLVTTLLRLPDINIIGFTDGENDSFHVTMTDLDTGTEYNITNLITSFTINSSGTQTILNPLNVSQFINLSMFNLDINSELADEYLDQRIFELLPDEDARQKQIDKFFEDYEKLKGQYPDWILENGLINEDWNADLYSENHDISTAQDGNPDIGIDEAESYITRLNILSNQANTGKTLQSLRDDLNLYLSDIDQVFPQLEDDRPIYENKSAGYLSFRGPNQGIIIRNANQDFIPGLDPNNPTWLNTGFTITMWVRFIDKTSEGTLFNFGNPTRGYRGDQGYGFKLETYVLNRNDPCPHPNHETWGTAAQDIDYGYPFENSNTARYVRLVVNDDVVNGGVLRDSVYGNNLARKYANGNIPDFSTGDSDDEEFRLLNTTFIPEDFKEWYFICATFNPAIDEDGSFDITNTACNGGNCNYDTLFWKNHINTSQNPGTSVFNSGRGNRCKVEIISRSDLLRARGYKVD